MKEKAVPMQRYWFKELPVLGLFGLLIGCSGNSIYNITPPPPGLIDTSTTLAVSPTFAAGVPVTLTATLSPSSAVGTVLFNDTLGGAPYISSTMLALSKVSQGVATVQETTGTDAGSALPVGTHELTAQFDAEENYVSSGSASVTFLVAAPNATCGLGPSASAFSTGTTSQSGNSYSADQVDESAVCAVGSGTSVELVNSQIASQSAVTSNSDPSGVGAAVLAYGPSSSLAGGGSVSIQGGSIATSAPLASGVVASGAGSSVALSNTTVRTTGGAGTNNAGTQINGGNAIAAFLGGSVALTNATISNGANGGALLNIGSGSAVSATGGTLTASNVGANLIDNASLSLNGTSFASPGGITIGYDSAATSPATLSMSGGTYSYGGPSSVNAVKILEGESVNITLNGTVFAPAPGAGGSTAVFIGATGQVGVLPASTVNLSMIAETFTGSVSLYADTTANISLTKGSHWTGMANDINLSLDASSTWSVSGNCVVGSISDASGIAGSAVTNISGNGYTIQYDPAQNLSLAGKTFTLANGGTLQPENQ